MPWEWETTCFPQSLVGAGAVARLAWVGHSTAGDGVARHSRAQNSTAQWCSPAHAQLESWRGCIREPASPPPGRPQGFPPELPRAPKDSQSPPPCPRRGSKAWPHSAGSPCSVSCPTTGLQRPGNCPFCPKESHEWEASQFSFILFISATDLFFPGGGEGRQKTRH